MILVSNAGEESISTIQHIAEITWKAAYTSILSPNQMKYMLDLFYSESSLQKQIKDGHRFIVAKEFETVIGFASYSLKSSEESKVYRLHKIYINPGQQGKGAGKILIDFIIQDIKPHNATGLELNVNRQNKALHFYQRRGFRIVKEEDFDIGEGYFMNDYVMILDL